MGATQPPGTVNVDATELTVGLLREQRPVVTYVDQFYWSCEECGWLGTGLSSVAQAMQEGGRHFEEMHFDRAGLVRVERKDQR